MNIDQAPQDINKDEFQLERVRVQAFVAATDPGCKKELISYDLLVRTDYAFGSIDKNGEWTGMIGMLKRNVSTAGI
ncbi:hypothetical protein TNCV_1511221 [Trichonephila clavipes]|nr:hypothetical protein TNCV_1511221 [Trichonephila clavipes]